MFKPVPGRFKDYISTPKPNMYQSVHTTVIGSEGIPFEIQIRTWQMHQTAEYGVAAHWKYKLGAEGAAAASGEEESFAWVRRLLENQQESDAGDFIHNLKIDMFADEVFVFSPKGDVVNLPAGATPIDFAYNIHSDVGNSMIGAKVNGRIVKIDHTLQNGDVVEIRTSKSAPGPSRDWLNIAKSGSARTKIKQWFKRERRDENIIRGREMLESSLKAEGLDVVEALQDEVVEPIMKRHSFNALDDMFASIGYGGTSASAIVSRIKDQLKLLNAEKKTAIDKLNAAAERREQKDKKTNSVNGVLVEGLDNCLVKFSRCCTPVPGDDIIGFITRGQGVSIHRKDCSNYINSNRNNENSGRWTKVSWANNIGNSYITSITVSSRNRNALVLDIASVLNALNAKVRTLAARDLPGGKAVTHITLEVHNSDELQLIMNRLGSIPGVTSVIRNGETTE